MARLLRLRKLLGAFLRGKLDGRKHVSLLFAELSHCRPGDEVRFVFDVDEMSASWAATTMPAIIAYCATPEIDLYPAVVGVLGSEKCWDDEFDLVASRSRCVFLDTADEQTRVAKLLGPLDPILAETLRLVQEHREVTGAGLKRLVAAEEIGATAWSNRLKDLHAMRLVRRSTRGREQLYTPVLEVAFDGPAGSRVADRELQAPPSA